MAHDPIDPQRIIQAVAQYYHLTLDELRSKTQSRHIVEPRWVAMFLLREQPRMSYPRIASLLGLSNHTTVLHGCREIESKLKLDRQLRYDVAQIRERLNSQEHSPTRVTNNTIHFPSAQRTRPNRKRG